MGVGFNVGSLVGETEGSSSTVGIPVGLLKLGDNVGILIIGEIEGIDDVGATTEGEGDGDWQ